MISYKTSEGKIVSIRQPVENDAHDIIAYAKIIFASSDQLLTTLEEYTITVDEEKKWINNFLKDPVSIIYVAETDHRIVGLLNFSAKQKKKVAHTGEFGVSVHPDFQGQGIGTMLIQSLLQWAKENNRIEKVILTVLASNQKAIKLYHQLGFKEEGRQIKAIKQPSGKYVDLIQMYFETK